MNESGAAFNFFKKEKKSLVEPIVPCDPIV
jgi:hypothetical protein